MIRQRAKTRWSNHRRGGPAGSGPTLWQGIITLVMGITLGGCIVFDPGAYGIRPEYPQLQFNLLGGIVYVEVDSLQPEMRWEVYPRPQDDQADGKAFSSRVSDVSYELKIWRVVLADEYMVQDVFMPKSQRRIPGDLVYSRQALPQPSHRLEEPLEPSTGYLWTVRARYHLDGHPRLTEWGISQEPGYPLEWSYSPRKYPPDRNPNYYRFKTPPQ